MVAVVLGGVSLAGGSGRPWETLLGALNMLTLVNDPALIDLSSSKPTVAWQLVLLPGVAIDSSRR